jgi:hypothetical protein
MEAVRCNSVARQPKAMKCGVPVSTCQTQNNAHKALSIFDAERRFYRGYKSPSCSDTELSHEAIKSLALQLAFFGSTKTFLSLKTMMPTIPKIAYYRLCGDTGNESEYIMISVAIERLPEGF